jgi:hypothetical protein
MSSRLVRCAITTCAGEEWPCSVMAAFKKATGMLGTPAEVWLPSVPYSIPLFLSSCEPDPIAE